MNLLLIMAATVYLQVTGPVSALQCDLDTTGAAQIVAGLTSKQLTSNRLQNGKLRIVVYGLNQSVFSGTFATVDAPVSGITGIVTSNPDGTASAATIKKISKPRGLQVR